MRPPEQFCVPARNELALFLRMGAMAISHIKKPKVIRFYDVNCLPTILSGCSLLKSISLCSKRYTSLIPAASMTSQHDLQHHQWPQRYRSAPLVSCLLAMAVASAFASL